MLKRRIEKVFVGLYFRYLNEGKKYLKIKGMIDITVQCMLMENSFLC